MFQVLPNLLETCTAVKELSSLNAKVGYDFFFFFPSGRGEIEAIVVPVCLAFLLIVLLGVLFCFNKRDL